MDKNSRRDISKQNKLEASNQKPLSSKGVVSGGRDGASWLSVIFLLWVNPLVRLAYYGRLEMKDLFPLPKGSDSESLLKRFDEAWGEEMKLPKGKRSLGRALWKCFKPAFILSGWMVAGMYVAIIAVPLITQQILLWVTREDNGKAQGRDLRRGLFFAFLLLLVGFVGSGLMNHHAFLMLFKLGMEVRSTVNGATFAKSLRLSNKARQRTTVGAMVILMSNDAQRLPDAIPICHGIWSAPTVIIILITIIIKIIGVAALAGIAFLVLMIPVQMAMVKLQIEVQQAQVQQTQSRINVVNDVLQGIRIVKFYAWEALFMQRIESLRNSELLKVKHSAFVQAYNLVFMRTTPYIMVMLTSITYYNMTGEFKPDVVFTAASLLVVLAMPLMMLPTIIAGFVQAQVSLSRLQDFLELDEVCEDDRVWTNRDGNGKGCGSVSITGKFVWRPDDEESEVGTAGDGDDGEEAGKDYEDNEESEESEDVDQEKWELDVENLEIPAGKLVSVIGQVGCGKSSLALAILGEMTKVEGTVTVDGSLAYVSQTAWIIKASVKENILMGRAYDKAWYRKVLRVCELHQDLTALPAGDKTEIGEKGINLSGGQKQRISLARAVYANADVYILDDPLSAVDARVGRHLFDSCLAGLLKGKTILLCTNQVHLVPRADLVIFMQSGHVIRRGSYFDLLMEDDDTLNHFLEKSKKNEQEFKEESTQEPENVCNLLGSSRRLSLHSDAAGRRWSLATPITPAPASHKRSRSRTRSSWSFGSAYGWRMAARAASDASAGMVEGSLLGEGVVDDIHSELAERILNTNGHHRRIESDNFIDRDDMDADSLVRLYSDASVYEDLDAHMHRRSKTGSARRKFSSLSGFSELSKSGEVDSAGVLQTVEGQAEGAVKWKIFRTYFRDGSGGWGLPMALLAMTAVTQATSICFYYWPSYWSDAYLDASLADEEKPPSWYQFIYIGLCLFTVGMHLLRGILFAVQAAMSSRFMHEALARGVIRAPVSFFDVTPVGRVLNRFTRDIDVMDLLLPRNISHFVHLLAAIVGSMVVIVLVLPWFAFVAMPLTLGFIWVLEYFRPISRDLQRLESMSRSPIVALFSETLNGVSTLRAYNQQEYFIERNSRTVNSSASTFYHMHCANRWLGIRLKAMGSFMNFAAAFIIVVMDYTGSFYVSAGVAGIVLIYTQQFTLNMSRMVRMGCETEAHITSVERAKEYAELKPEADLIVDNNRPPTGWPETGALQMTSVEMRYRPELDLVLKGVTLDVKGSERVGIAGRTGSGKSSLMVALFRIVEPCGGTITIDGVDATQIGLQDLREAISMIPQDPVMFCGTIRQNLDPFGWYSDAAIWAALEAGMLGSYVSGLQGKLESEVSEGGGNLSLGQRQLFCLARAVLRRNKILVMDEATANLDLETDALIQRAIREEFSGCTVLTIAHRLETIMDSDRILVMKDGKVGEFDTPVNLVSREKSLLMDLIRQTGSESARRLVSIANGNMELDCSIAVPENVAGLASVREAEIMELEMSDIDGSGGAMASFGHADESDDGSSSQSPPITEVSNSESSMGNDLETARGTLTSGDDCMKDLISQYKLEGPQSTSGVLHGIQRFEKQSSQEFGVQPIDVESSDRIGGDLHPTE